MISVLHVFSDDKFFDITSEFFDVIPDLNNIYVFYTNNSDYKFKYIKSHDKVNVVTDKKKYYEILKSDEIDIVYFHSFPPRWYKYIRKIPQKTKTVWWIWGYDIYYKWRGCKPLIDVRLYKPRTQAVLNTQKQRKGVLDYLRLIYYGLTYIHDCRIRRKAISRVDYVSPVIDLEYQLLRLNCPYFRADSFMINSGPGIAHFNPLLKKHSSGNILIGNSLTATNNHLDIFSQINECKLEKSQRFIIPISYGTDIDKNFLKGCFHHPQVEWLENFISQDEYNKILNSVSYAVFGVMRQQAMGNISYCLKNGVKLFLYSDSMMYRYLVSNGFVVYKIEDITYNSFETALGEDSVIKNYTLFKEKWGDNVNYAYKEIQRILNVR